MGLFDSLKKNIDTLAKEVEKHRDDIQKGIEQLGIQTEAKPESSFEPSPAPQPAYSAPVMKAPVDQFGKFDDIISRNFADCEVKRNLPASALDSGCHPACTPVQFMFYEDGEPVLAVVLVRTNTYRGRNVLGTKEICEKLGIRYIRFYEEYENEESYVVNRIKENL